MALRLEQFFRYGISTKKKPRFHEAFFKISVKLI